jgi:hypothetical protein
MKEQHSDKGKGAGEVDQKTRREKSDDPLGTVEEAEQDAKDPTHEKESNPKER